MRQDPRMNKPFIRLGHQSQKPLNTTGIRVKPHLSSNEEVVIHKDSINWRRINKEANRHHYAEAKYVPFPRLVLKREPGQRYQEYLVALTTDSNHIRK